MFCVLCTDTPFWCAESSQLLHSSYQVMLWFTSTRLFNSYSASRDNWCTATLWNRIITAQCEGMGEVGSARYEPALLPPCPSIGALCYSNCQRSAQSHQQSKRVKNLSPQSSTVRLFIGQRTAIIQEHAIFHLASLQKTAHFSSTPQ